MSLYVIIVPSRATLDLLTPGKVVEGPKWTIMITPSFRDMIFWCMCRLHSGCYPKHPLALKLHDSIGATHIANAVAPSGTPELAVQLPNWHSLLRQPGRARSAPSLCQPNSQGVPYQDEWSIHSNGTSLYKTYHAKAWWGECVKWRTASVWPPSCLPMGPIGLKSPLSSWQWSHSWMPHRCHSPW